MVGEAALEAAHGLVAGLALGDLAVVVGAAEAVAHADLGERSDVQCQVQLPVPAAGQPMPGPVGAGHLDRGDTGVDVCAGGAVRVVDDGTPPPATVVTTPRIGITKAVDLPWRFLVPS